jgi:hypothetical protein
MMGMYPTFPWPFTAWITKYLGSKERDWALHLRIVVFLGYIYDSLDAVKTRGFELL